MFAKMRRKNNQSDTAAAIELLQKGAYGILATMGENGYPYAVPLNYAYADNKIYFHCAPDAGQKIANIKHCPRVCFTVVGNVQVLPSKFSARYESVIAFGAIREAVDKRPGLELLIQKYSPAYVKEGMEYIDRAVNETGVYEIVIEHLTGKKHD